MDSGGGAAATPAASRGRLGSGMVGTAVPRPRPVYGLGGGNGNVYVSHPFYGPWGWYCPWFGPGFGWYAGYIGYNPYFYGATSWGWGRYGYYYDPFFYGGSADLYYSGGGGGGGGGGYSSGGEVKSRIGSVRLKVNPGSAKVYIDGVLYGEADEFGGMKNHLELDGGRWVMELRADGYETLRREITVEPGRTMTERATLNKKK
jgi:hypothetical protein